MTPLEHLDRLKCTPHVRNLADHAFNCGTWIPTDRTDVTYIGLKAEEGTQIAVYINRAFVAFALDDGPGTFWAEHFGARRKDKSPTTYVELFEHHLEAGPDMAQLLGVAEMARERNRTRIGKDGERSSTALHRPRCATCRLELPTTNVCDEHGSPSE